jgi:transcriptional regulator with XRE-family HTH domain
MFQYEDEESQDTIGSILRQQRESKKLNLEKIAEELKIRPQYLEALEKDQFELLPGKLYQRSFLKAYAQFLNLDQDHILKMFEQYGSSKESFRKESEGTLPVGKKVLEESIKEGSTLQTEPRFSQSRAGYWFAIWAGLVLGIFCLIYLAKPGMKKKHDIASELSASAIESRKGKPEVVDTTSFLWRLDNLLTNSTQMILRIEAKKDTWVKVTADEKTLFSGIIVPELAIEFKANDYFSINLGNNEGLEVYLNGMRMNKLEKGIHYLDRKNYKNFFSAGSVGQESKTP